MLSERLQILIDPGRRARLEAEARRRGVSVASLIREAIDRTFPATTQERLRAWERIAAAEAMPVPHEGELRAEIDAIRSRRA
ncbi:MAG TPA: antitoxin [Actinomycetota bacterium]